MWAHRLGGAARLGATDFYGNGSAFRIDSRRPFTVVTQFHATGDELTSIKRFYLQGGKRIDLDLI